MPAKIHKYQRFKNAENPDVAGVAETAALVALGLKFIETVSDCVVPETLLLVVASVVACEEIVCVFPSKVTDFVANGATEPILTPEIMSPGIGTPLSCKFPSEEIWFGMLAEIFTLSICANELFTAEIIK
jgi:hypothetical protein